MRQRRSIEKGSNEIHHVERRIEKCFAKHTEQAKHFPNSRLRKGRLFRSSAIPRECLRGSSYWKGFEVYSEHLQQELQNACHNKSSPVLEQRKLFIENIFKFKELEKSIPSVALTPTIATVPHTKRHLASSVLAGHCPVDSVNTQIEVQWARPKIELRQPS